MCQLSLVLAELLTNTARHAFALGCRATLKPHLGRRNAAVTMIVVDDGVGLRPGFDPGPYGLRIVLALLLQLDGRLQIQGQKRGAAFLVALALDGGSGDRTLV
jgi:two-component sensor histidine kinase